MIVQEKAGKPEFREIDTFYYDNKKRLVKHTNFAKTAYVIHRATANYARTVETHTYKSDSVFIRSYTTNSLNKEGQGAVEYKIRVFNKEGLETKNYSGTKKEEIKLYDRFGYIYY